MTSATVVPESRPATRLFHIDQAHSEVTFRVRHLLSRVRGRFSGFAGRIAFNPDEPTASSVDLTIRADSIDTNQPDRDAHLRSSDFFEVERFPALTFVSSRIVEGDDGSYRVGGTLTIRGVARTIELPVRFLGSARDPWGNEKLAFEAETTINRKDYGLTWNAALETGGVLVGDDVTISVAIQAAAE